MLFTADLRGGGMAGGKESDGELKKKLTHFWYDS